MSTAEAFGAVLRRVRIGAGLTQEELAERAGVSVRGISDLERGLIRVPRPATLRLLLAALAPSPPDLAALTESARQPAAPEPISAPETVPPVPAPPTPLVGRNAELAAVLEMLRDGARLVTLTGPGGVGKTRLALAVAADTLLPPVFVDLSSVADDALIPGAIGQALGLPEDVRRSPVDALIDGLRERRLLLILDNVEQLSGAGALVAALLAGCPRLVLLVTSRGPLRVRAERVYPVAPLPVPVGGRVTAPAELNAIPSAALLVQRARAVRPGFAIDGGNAAAVATICRALDGLPLALELAAPWLRILPPGELAARLDRRLTVLTIGPADLPPRQRTLRDTLAWSHDLLDEGERVLFRRLAVFAGGFTLDAVERVMGDGGWVIGDGGWGMGDGDKPSNEGRTSSPSTPAPVLSPQSSVHSSPPVPNPQLPAPAVLDGIVSLVDKSLIQVDEGAGGEPRWRMLAIVREFALERLAAEEAAPVRERHARHMLALTQVAASELTGADQTAWLNRLEREHDNLRAAFEWAIERPEPEIALGLAGSLWRFWTVRGHVREGASWLRRALAVTAPVDAALRAKALNGLGNLASELGDYDEARAHYEASLALWREEGERPGIADVLNNLGLLAGFGGDYATARALLAESLAIRRELGDGEGVALALSNLGDLASDEQKLDEAQRLHEEALAIRAAQGDVDHLGYSAFNLGEVARRRGDLAAADALFLRALGCFEQVDDRGGIAYALHHRGLVASGRGAGAEASAFMRAALAIRQGVSDRRGMLDGIEGLAAAEAARDPARSVRLWAAAENWRTRLGMPRPPAEQAGHADALAAVRAALGEAAFTTAWTLGQLLSLADAVAMSAEDED